MAYDVTIEAIDLRGLVALRAGADGQTRVAENLGICLPRLPHVLTSDELLVVPLAADEWLLRADDAEALHLRLDSCLEGLLGAVAVVSDAYSGYRLSGPQVGDVMAQIVALNLDDSLPAADDDNATTCGRTGVGRVAGVVMRTRSPEQFDLLVDSTHAQYANTLLHVCAGLDTPT